ncbi:MAG: hypothetical protein K6F82_06820, partial [Sphaerochaetaceae bacterium]|nr:hypothetical protein [Sphaerochaetaceae bacterium]
MLPSESVFATVVSNLGIQISKKNKPVETNADFPDLGLRSYLFGADNSLSEEISPYDEVPGKIQVNLIEDDFSCNYVYVKISDNSFYFIGPYLSSIVSPIEIKKKLEVKGLKNIDYNYLSSYYHSLPVIRDQNLMQAIIQAHCVIRFGADNYNLVSIKLHLTTFQDNTEKKKLYSEYHMEKQSE